VQESKRKGPKDEADGLAKRLQRINEALDEANKKAVNARSAAESAQKEADGLRPKYDELKVSLATCTPSILWSYALRADACGLHAVAYDDAYMSLMHL
jgi:chromosome segregation ATPase